MAALDPYPCSASLSIDSRQWHSPTVRDASLLAESNTDYSMNADATFADYGLVRYNFCSSSSKKLYWQEQ